MTSECCNTKGPQISCCGKNERDVRDDPDRMPNLILRLAISLVLVGQSMVFGLGINITPPEIGSAGYLFLHMGLILSAIIVMILLGGPLLRDVVKMVQKRRISLEGLFILSAMGALVGSLISTFTGRGQVYYEVVSIVLVIYTVGKIVGMRSKQKAIDESHALRESFNYAYVIQNGKKEKKRLEEVGCCCEVIVGPGNAVTVDGIITSGEGFIKETAMTGELEPVVKRMGEPILAGSYSVDGTFSIKPTALKGARKFDILLAAVEDAQLAPSALQEQADRVMQWFLPFVISVSLGTFLFWLGRSSWVNALFNSMAVLLVACPCAIGLATPIAVWSGLWKLSTLGLVSRSGEFLDTLGRVNRMVFDKTGTLSEQSLELVAFVVSGNMKEQEDRIKEMVSSTETTIDHPIARVLATIFEGETNHFKVLHSRVIPGQGIEAQLIEIGRNDIIQLHLGEKHLMPKCESNLWDPMQTHLSKKAIYVSINDEPAAIAFLDEQMRSGVSRTLRELKELGIKGIILTGDNSGRYQEIEGVEVIAGLNPENKESRIRFFEDNGDRVVFIGDGVNDAAAMSASSASIAMGGGAALTQSVASAILMGQTLDVLPRAIKLCRKIRSCVKGNMIYAAMYNSIGMALASMGILHPVVAALIMLISSIGVSIRTTRITKQF